ncbi:MAG: leucine-rich repeat protein, partial [Bacteroidales bacterium]|nr:leucine-rich repeat protein [Candidatus Sodaliphilus aphodohippi]
ELTGVTMLGKGVFEGCYSLNEVTLGENLTEIPNFTFQSCSSLSGLIVPAKVKRIGECAFMNSGMEAINIPSAVETIDTRAFQWCSSLEDVTFNEGLKTIGEYAFSDSYVERVALPSTLETIGKNAFSNCTSIRTIVFPPKSIANMASGLFNGLWRLSRVECEATVPPVIPANTFDGSNGTLYVPTASIEAYKAADGWKYFGNVEGTTPVTGNGDANCDGVIDVLDFNIVINYMLGMGGFSSEDAMNNANVNGDSSIDIVDVNGIINIILGIK